MVPFIPASDSFAILHQKLVTLLAEVTAPRHGNLPDDARELLADGLAELRSAFGFEWEKWREAQPREPRKALPFDTGPNWASGSNPLMDDWS